MNDSGLDWALFIVLPGSAFAPSMTQDLNISLNYEGANFALTDAIDICSQRVQVSAFCQTFTISYRVSLNFIS